MQFLQHPPRFLFFNGKGGVGKTSIASATAVRLAAEGRQVLLVSTDPASNVGQVFGLGIGNQILPIPDVPKLSALEIDPQAAAQRYRDRIVDPVRGVLPDTVVKGIEEQLSGACTTEIAAFDEFTELLVGSARTREFDHIVFDAAPTGHTIRLLQLPGAWSDFLEAGKGDASCLGPLAGLEKQREQYHAAVQALADPQRTRLILVARAQAATLREAARTHDELVAIGLSQDRIARKPFNLVGSEALQQLFSQAAPATTAIEPVPSGLPELPALATLVDQIAADGHGLVMLMGKGGVGKTTLAAAVAVEQARRGLPVHLTTSDPAGHLAETLDGSLEQLTVSRIDPHTVTERYRQQVLATKGVKLDAAGRAMLEEDLRSPCTEEIAVFQAFSRIIREAGRKFVVMDTAPTGHTLLLLDATGAYHRDIVRQMGGTGVQFKTPMMQLQDPKQTKVLIVTLAETMPVLEAASLQTDLRRAGIEPWAWVINNSLAAGAPKSALLRQRAHNERREIDSVVSRYSHRHAVVPLAAVEPVGVERLLELSAPAAAKGN